MCVLQTAVSSLYGRAPGDRRTSLRLRTYIYTYIGKNIPKSALNILHIYITYSKNENPARLGKNEEHFSRDHTLTIQDNLMVDYFQI